MRDRKDALRVEEGAPAIEVERKAKETTAVRAKQKFPTARRVLAEAVT